MFTKLRSSFTQKPDRNSRATIELVAFSRRLLAASSVYGVTNSPTASVDRATTRPAPTTWLASCTIDRPEERITVSSDCSDIRASAKSVPISAAAGRRT